MLGAVAHLTAPELALISAGTALAGVALGIGGQAWLDRRREGREARRIRDAAIGELLTATADLLSAVDSIRAAYKSQASQFRHYLGLTARLTAIGFLAVADVDWTERPAGPGGRMRRGWQTYQWLSTAGRMGFAIDRLTSIDRDLDDKQRTAALDVSTVLIPRMVRFYGGVAALTLGDDKAMADWARKLSGAVRKLLDDVLAKQHRYGRARSGAERALADFRAAADKRQR